MTITANTDEQLKPPNDHNYNEYRLEGDLMEMGQSRREKLQTENYYM